MSESSGRSSSDADEVIIESDGSKFYTKILDKSNINFKNNVNNVNNNSNNIHNNIDQQSDDQMIISSTKYNQSDPQLQMNQRNNLDIFSSNQHDKMENALELLQKV